jgi:hypothetical protein
VLLAGACAGGKGHGKGRDGGAGSGSGSGPTAGSGSGTGTGTGSGSTPTGGIVEAKVEWKDAPATVRASPGRDPCGGPRRGRRIHTLWGVADAVVIIEGADAATAPATPVRIAVRDCELVPLVTVAPAAPAAIDLYDADQRRHVVTLEGSIALDQLATAATTATKKARRAVLAWAGSEVEVTAAEPGAIGLALDATPDDLAWVVVAPPHARIGVTDDTGAVSFTGLSAGTHAVTAWLPPAGGQPGKLVTGTVAVETDKLVKLTLDIAAGTVTASTPVPAITAAGAVGAGAGSGSDDDDSP